uniref:Uncharacterized protein n=1 Tax=Arundo donax TaxID=35708 RepID=A0A0A8YMR5_ARUDO
MVEECRRKADKTSSLVDRIWDPKTQESHCFSHRSTSLFVCSSLKSSVKEFGAYFSTHSCSVTNGVIEQAS